MHEYWQRRLEEARKINDQIEADLESALAEVSPEVAAPVRAVMGGGGVIAPPRRRYARVDRRRTPVRIAGPSSTDQVQVTLFPRRGTAATSARAVALSQGPARQAVGVVGPLWQRGVLAAVYALMSNAVLFGGLLAVGATQRISTSASLPATLAATSILVAATGTVAFWTLRQLLTWPDAAFRLLVAAALVSLLVSFIVTPGATFLAAVLAVVMTSMSLGSARAAD
jgi:hypothetical protein